MLRTRFTKVALFFVAFLTTALFATAAWAEDLTVNQAAVETQVASASTASVPATPDHVQVAPTTSNDTGWFVNISFANRYHCPLFGVRCTGDAVTQGSLFYKFPLWGGTDSIGGWGSIGSGLLASEINAKNIFDIPAEFPYVGRTDLEFVTAFNLFNPERNSFGASRNDMFDFEAAASWSREVATWRGVTFGITPSIRTLVYVGLTRDCSFENYGGVNPQLTFSATNGNWTASVMGGKVWVFMGHYREPWQFRAAIARSFENGLVATLSYGAASAPHHVEQTNGWMLDLGYHVN
jgi:hypothetical protein